MFRDDIKCMFSNNLNFIFLSDMVYEIWDFTSIVLDLIWQIATNKRVFQTWI